MGPRCRSVFVVVEVCELDARRADPTTIISAGTLRKGNNAPITMIFLPSIFSWAARANALCATMI